MPASAAIELRLPSQDLARPHFAPADPVAVQQWLDRLSRADFGHFARELYRALAELNRCPLAPATRLAVLEVLRPAILGACRTLQNHLLDPPVVLPRRLRQIHELTQALRAHLATGYCIVAGEARPRRWLLSRRGEHDTLCAQAIHRALTTQTQILLETSRLYLDVLPGFWSDTHRLGQLAVERGLERREVDDGEAGTVHPLSIEQIYLKALLLGCVDSRRLTPQAMQAVTDALNEWLPLVALEAYRVADDDRLAVHSRGDMPPVYNALFHPPLQTGDCRLLAVERLQAELDRLLGDPAVRPPSLDEALLRHLRLAWGHYSRRAFLRIDSTEQLALCVGLDSLHYFARGEVAFDSWLDPEAGNRPSGGQPVQVTVHCADHQLQVINLSPGGYCLQWPAEIAARLQMGELVGVREARQTHWGAGIVRWVHRHGDSVSSIGVELIGPAAIALAAGTGEQHCLAALLPAFQPVGQTATLIAPPGQFAESDSTQLVQPGRTLTVQLTRQVPTGGAIDRFEYDIITDSAAAGDDAAAAFDDLWQSL